ncbi:MAG: hypothetical protein KC468_35880, partial [Myxococcales bacterium]|nr:hypothetical protein [Myxococcales bacterium]
MLYYRAELLWAAASRLHASGDETRARAAFDRARGAFEQALAAKPGGFTEDAAYAQLLATMNALGLETRAAPGRRGDGSRDAGGAFPITDYSGDERRLLRSGELFARYVDDPENEGTQLVLYTRARLASEHNRFDEAERHARALLDSSDG